MTEEVIALLDLGLLNIDTTDEVRHLFKIAPLRYSTSSKGRY